MHDLGFRPRRTLRTVVFIGHFSRSPGEFGPRGASLERGQGLDHRVEARDVWPACAQPLRTAAPEAVTFVCSQEAEEIR